jgi:hypothetical protein
MDLQAIIARTWADPEFKKAFLANPRRIIEQSLGVSLPPDVNIWVHQETESDVHLVLPRAPSLLPNQD